MKELKVKLTFIEPILGTSPANPDIYREFIGSHAPDAASVEDEVAALGADAVAEKSMTISRDWTTARRFCTTIRSRAFSRTPAAASARSRVRPAAKSRLTKRKSTS